MTDRYNALIVVLEDDMRDDDAAATIAAIQQIRGVLSVTGNVAGVTDTVAYARSIAKLQDQLWEVLGRTHV